MLDTQMAYKANKIRIFSNIFITKAFVEIKSQYFFKFFDKLGKKIFQGLTEFKDN